MLLDDIYRHLSAILQDVFNDSSLSATPTLTAAEVEGWDSFSHLRLMLTVERAFDVDFAASETTSLGNVGELASLIATKLREKETGYEREDS